MDHDNFVRRMLSYRDVARAQLQWLLPEPLARDLDWSTLRPGPTDTADDLGTELRSDSVFAIDTTAGQPVLVHILFEHQRRAHPLMAFRMNEYMVRIWRAYLDEVGGEPTQLPPIIPIVLYNGTRAWNRPTAIDDIVPVPQRWALEPYRLRGRFLLCDLSRTPDEELGQKALHAHLRLGLLVLKHASADDLWERFIGWGATLAEVVSLDNGMARLRAVFQYLRAIARRPSEEERRRVIDLLPSIEEDIVTWAEELKAEGRTSGMREMVRTLLIARFGTLAEDVEAKLSQATDAQLATWGRRLLDASLTLDAILAD